MNNRGRKKKEKNRGKKKKHFGVCERQIGSDRAACVAITTQW